MLPSAPLMQQSCHGHLMTLALEPELLLLLQPLVRVTS
jgi:hypothetical protein